jgi:cAMP phosphodiesterase
MMPLSHGKSNSAANQYESSAFFVRHDPTSKEFLFFGDVEPDSIAASPQTIKVWRAAAPKIPDTLSTIFIECSWASGRKDDLLYGHLTPEHLVAELTALASEVVLARTARRGGKEQVVPQSPRTGSPLRKKPRKGSGSSSASNEGGLRGALDGLRVHIIHCKDTMENGDRPIGHLICDQVRDLVQAMGLGAEILPTDQGMRIGE